MNELQNLLNEMEALRVVYMDETLAEEETDTAYEAFWSIGRRAAGIVIEIAEVEERIALKMVMHHRDKLATIIKRAAVSSH